MNLGTTNPFSDPDFKKQILSNEGRVDSSSSEDYEILQAEEVVSDELKNVISTAPKIPGKVKNVILDASAIARNDKEAKASEISLALNEVFTQYNKEYGTSLEIDFNSLSNTLVNVSDPESRHTLELYLSEVFQSIRPILLLHMISKLALAIDYILDPARMLGGDMTIQDTFVAVEKIMQFIQQLEDMKSEIIVPGASLELKKLSEKVGTDGNPESQKAVEEFMKLMKTDIGL